MKHGCPRWQQSHNMAKISKSYILTLPHPQGHVMSVKCEEPIDEPTDQVWLLYHHPNFNYCSLIISGTELRTNRRTDRQTDGRTDEPITRCPRRTFQAGGIKMDSLLTNKQQTRFLSGLWYFALFVCNFVYTFSIFVNVYWQKTNRYRLHV